MMRSYTGVWTPLEAVAATLLSTDRIVLAVSGGLDSMVLLDAAARVPDAASRITVATFDHGTGVWASEATAFAAEESRRRGIGFVQGTGRAIVPDEASWREARWAFLGRIARELRATVVTAHTRDDQIETVFIRLLRQAGPRGLAGLLAPSPVLRPLIQFSREQIVDYAHAREVRWMDDPSNNDLRHLRNRVRHQILPAIMRVRPGFTSELLEVGADSANWRAKVESVVDGMEPAFGGDGTLSVGRAVLSGYGRSELGVLWPALAARAGLRLDRRGTHRLVEFTNSGEGLGRIPLAGGGDVVGLRDRFVIRSRVSRESAPRQLAGALRFNEWDFHPESDANPADPWMAALPAGLPLTVRSWLPGDRIRASGRPAARRVKRYLAEAGIPGPMRVGWPVVLAGDDIVWIPGVCRSDAATVRPGRPVVFFACERSGR